MLYKLITLVVVQLFNSSNTLHKLLPVHPSGHILGVHIFDVGET